MNIKEIFDKAENGTLTFEQFESIAKSDGAKFTDLSEGKYVSKAKYDDDIKIKEDSIAQLNGTITQRDTDLADLQEKLKNAGTDATKLSELQMNFDSLQNKYTSDMENYQTKLAQQAYEFATREFAGTQKFTSNAAKRDFTAKMIAANLKYDAEKQKILGADDFVTSYKEDNPDAFVIENATDKEVDTTPVQPKPQFVQATTGQSTTQPQDNNLFHFNFTDIRGTKKD